MAIHSDMQGPCPDGFHVPTNTERGNVYTIWTTLGGSSSGGVAFGTALRLPFAGKRAGSSGAVVESGFGGNYWSCTYRNDEYSYYLYIDSGGAIAPNCYSYGASYGNSIRPFRDTPVTPTSSWTKLYGTSIEAGGIFWDSLSGLISLSSNGSTWITMSDKNLGATTVWSSGDTLSEANCGKFYQRGNNYGFPYSGTLSNISTATVNASAYGPGNYYSSSTFIKRTSSPYRWDSSNNQNLWGGISQGTWRDPLTHGAISTWHMERYQDYPAMRGPCDEGFHVPTKDEWVALCGILTTTFSMARNATTMGTYLKMPLAGYRNYSNAVYASGDYGCYWSSTPSNYNVVEAYRLEFSSRNIYPHQKQGYRSFGYCVRCFKDSPVIPTSSWTTLYDGSSIASGAGVFYNATNGLISVSGDGTNWYTIMDKNLGATTVFNQGDTVSSANSGYFYQWGNNYGFSHSGNLTTSSTQVDASNYGPGNYYSNNTFITRSGGPYGWDSSNNNNLWGGVTGAIISYRPRGPVAKLKTYEEIVAMATAEGYPWTNTLVELNTDIDGYRTSLSDYIQFRVSASGYVLYGIYDSGYYIGYYNYSPYTWQALEDD